MQKRSICIIGLGYVGLPLAHAFAKAGHEVHGYDIAEPRIKELTKGHDRTNELTDEQLKQVTIDYTTDPTVMAACDVIILAIPTPVDDDNNPDLTLLEKASATVGKHIKKGTIVVYESTVYPGVTEDVCGTIIARESGLMCGKDFTLGYSPERINPGDREHTVEKIVKIVAGQDAKTTDTLVELYGSVVKAGIHRASSIKVAEMAKAIENAQRDLNIAFINEIAMLCNGVGIETKDVLEAAATKWNFLKFKPGLVGGHCIGVDPYYLVEMAKRMHMPTQIITAGRSINDGMSGYVAHQVAKHLPPPLADGSGLSARVLVLGLTFKENIPDTRNSKSKDVLMHLQKLGYHAEAHDPFLTSEEITARGMTPGSLQSGLYDAILLLVPHKEYMNDGTQTFLQALKTGGVFYDLKSLMNPEDFMQAGKKYLAL